jgi:hypothetical protein
MEECIVCFEERDPIAFPCAHKVCSVCYPKLKRCPLCNYEVIIPITPIVPRVSHAHHITELTRYSSARDIRHFQLACCLILLGVILLSLYRQ